MIKKMTTLLLILICGVIPAYDAYADETALFTTLTAPDALIILDLSGSMAWNPAGDDLVYGSTDSCYVDAANCSGTGCSGGYCGSSKSSTTFYANNICTVPDTTNCVGTNCANGFCSTAKGATLVYANSSCSTPDTINCRGTGCGRSDGFCNNSISAATYYAHSSCSTPDTNQCRYSETWSDCSGGFCASPHSSWTRSCTVACTTTGCTTPCATASCSKACISGGCTKNCSRLNIAKRSIFNILDDNNDNTINTSDESSLGVRIGYVRYYNCGDDDTGNDYNSGCIKLVKAINSSYSSINTSAQSENASGGTPIKSALNEAKLYLDVHKAADSSKNCRQKFVIFITDGSDTYSCNSDGSECDNDRYKNRRETVAKAKLLADAGYKVFVIGFGTAMPPYLQNSLNWMAYYGGTDNPNAANSGSTTAYSIATGCNIATDPITNPTACCTNTNLTACYPSGVTSCGTDSSRLAAACYDSTKPYPGTTGYSTANYRASYNDPGYLDLSGYAFLAADADQLVAAVKAAINIIREATYSFSQASVQSSRTVDENFLYEGSFQPVSGDPFWLGHLRKFSINSDGSVGSALWDAGELLKAATAEGRNIKTYKGGSLTDFTTANITEADLGVATTAIRDSVVGYIRGETAYNPDNWKLGDVFRSTPITVGSPSVYYQDTRDANNAFANYRSTHIRASASGNRLILAGANDGQMHAFKTSDGSEAWSFIPPNLLPKLKNIAHAVDPSALTHQYFVDSPVTVAEAWLGTGAGTSKSSSDWKTLMVFGEGRGPGVSYLWSSSQYCDSGFSATATYNASYPYYCGYYALDLTGTECTTTSGSCTAPQPVFKWRLGGTSSGLAPYAPYLAEPWSKFMVGRVMISGNEKWVGFVGGGGGIDSARGNGFFVVDLSDGSILWGRTHANDGAMDFGMLAGPATVDTDNDGFIDTVYLGDRGNNMWRFKFCTASDGSTCNTSNWTGGLLFNGAGSGLSRPIFNSAAVAKDSKGNFWIYWGTGDKLDPTATSAVEKIYALKDDDRTTTRVIGNMQDITSGTYTDTAKYGWYVTLAAGGEKVLADPTVFGGVVYFTTFTPASGTDPCLQGGTAKLYGFNYTTGGGAISDIANPQTPPVRSMVIGTGIPSAPVISLPPGSGTPDLYVTTSGGGMTGASTQRANLNPPGLTNRTNLLYWGDKRIQ